MEHCTAVTLRETVPRNKHGAICPAVGMIALEKVTLSGRKNQSDHISYRVVQKWCGGKHCTLWASMGDDANTLTRFEQRFRDTLRQVGHGR